VPRDPDELVTAQAAARLRLRPQVEDQELAEGDVGVATLGRLASSTGGLQEEDWGTHKRT
jgi:hypothetical protein